MNERGLTTVLKGIYAFAMKRIDALSKRVEKAQKSAESANSAASAAQTAADAAQQSANNANTNANSKVSSVNKKTGVVTLTATDVGAMAASSPTGTGTFAMNRKTGSTWGNYSSILGKDCTASGTASHAEGSETVSSMKGSHSEGINTTASGAASHAEGTNTTASNISAHSEGSYTTASGAHAHAEGWDTTASGDNAHAEGNHTTAAGKDQHAQGRWNIEDAEGKHAHIVGNGSSDSARSNAHTLDWSGNSWYAGKVTAQGYEVEADGTSHALAASDVGAISDTDGSVQNAHLADSAVTTDKLAEGERMTSANIVSALGYEPEEKSGEWELIEEITLTEDTAEIVRTAEPDGSAINLAGCTVTLTFLSWGTYNRYISMGNESVAKYITIGTVQSATMIRGSVILLGNMWFPICYYGSASSTSNAGGPVSGWKLQTTENIPTITYIRIYSTSDGYKYPAGTTIRIYGIRA